MGHQRLMEFVKKNLDKSNVELMDRWNAEHHHGTYLSQVIFVRKKVLRKARMKSEV